MRSFLCRRRQRRERKAPTDEAPEVLLVGREAAARRVEAWRCGACARGKLGLRAEEQGGARRGLAPLTDRICA
jgi:hypothetical protein